jgi:hypothetical protein
MLLGSIGGHATSAVEVHLAARSTEPSYEHAASRRDRAFDIRFLSSFEADTRVPVGSMGLFALGSRVARRRI